LPGFQLDVETVSGGSEDRDRRLESEVVDPLRGL
jgi:hypothetical protein